MKLPKYIDGPLLVGIAFIIVILIHDYAFGNKPFKISGVLLDIYSYFLILLAYCFIKSTIYKLFKFIRSLLP